MKKILSNKSSFWKKYQNYKLTSISDAILNEGIVRPINSAFVYDKLFNLKHKSHRGEGPDN
jgi:hypothetical protein